MKGPGLCKISPYQFPGETIQYEARRTPPRFLLQSFNISRREV